MLQERTSLKGEMENSRSQLQATSKLEPEMSAMRKQLAQATTDIRAQQKVVSSSEEFVKGIFSTHFVEFFRIGQPPENLYAVLPPPPGTNRSVVFLVLHSVPIPETLQLQYHIYTQPQNSYLNVHNLAIFFWADPPD